MQTKAKTNSEELCEPRLAQMVLVPFAETKGTPTQGYSIQDVLHFAYIKQKLPMFCLGSIIGANKGTKATLNLHRGSRYLQ